MSKSMGLTPDVSTATLRATLHGWRTCSAWQASIAVCTNEMPSGTGPAHAVHVAGLGGRGAEPDADRRPAGRPSVVTVEHRDRVVRHQRAVDQGRGAARAGEGHRLEEVGDRRRGAHRVDHRLLVRVAGVLVVLPGQVDQAPAREVGGGDGQPVARVDAAVVARVVGAQVAERLDAQVAEHPAEPPAQVVALVGAVLEQHGQPVGEEAQRTEVPAREPAVRELREVEGAGDVLEAADRLAALLERGEDGADDRAGGGPADAGEGVAGVAEGLQRAGQRDALDPTSLQDEVGDGRGRGRVGHVPTIGTDTPETRRLGQLPRSPGKSSSFHSRVPSSNWAAPDASSPSRPRSSTRRILPLIVFGRSKNSSRRTRRYGAQVLARVLQDLERRLLGRLVTGGEGDVGLGDRVPHRVRRRHDRRLGDRRVLDQHRLQLERADLVVAGLEHVVGAPDVGDVAVLVAGSRRRRCGRSRRPSPRRCAPRRPGSRSSARAGARRGRGRSRPRPRPRPSGSSAGRPARPGGRAAAGPSTRASRGCRGCCRPARWSPSGRSRRGSSGPTGPSPAR